ncbi:MAG: hypothetical protein WD053_04140 [Gracilimonas sp.]
MKVLTSFLICTVIVSGCQIFGSDDDTFTVSPDEVSVIEKNVDSVTFKVLNNCASACWVNLGEKVNKAGNSFEIRLIAENSGENCLAVCLELERMVSVDIEDPGNYSFEFIHHDSIYHDIELSFP